MGERIERVLLWGFMASGKTAVGAELARRLGWAHVDLDEVIVRGAGKPIARIFREEGEDRFRSLEAELSRELLAQRQTVLSPGGGWVTHSGLVERLPAGTLTVWLQVSPATALERVRANPDGPERPLLASPDPLGRIRDLLAAREPLYARAAHAIPTDSRSIDSIVDEIEALVRSNLSVFERQTVNSDG
ncbi:MAG TPA: shikimate kinase [Longimicrobiaceae bacterium]